MYGILHSVDKWLEKVVESDIILITSKKEYTKNAGNIIILWNKGYNVL